VALVLFLLFAGAIVLAWNRSFERIPTAVTLLFFTIVLVYQASTLFTNRVDVPGGLAAAVYPWKADVHPQIRTNTGIVPTQLVPWTRVARDAILSGEWPLWNRDSASGSPLLANQQTAIFHPFTLVGVFVLSIGKAFTLSVCLRLFTLLFFTFAFLRGLPVTIEAAIFGAVAYTFCTFHIVWLLFPLGLATMMLPVALAGAQQLFAQPRVASFLLLTIGLGASVLGGHPESAFWVWVVTAAYVAFNAKRRVKAVCLAATAFIAAAALTAFVWMPTVALLPHISRTTLMRSEVTNPPNHNLGPEWIGILVAPNLLGTVQTGTWKGPSTHHGAILEDYGEMASGYAGLITIALAVYAVLFVRRKEAWFFSSLAVLTFLTITEVPGWREFLRLIPIAGLTFHQRLRVVWVLGIVGLATLALDAAPLRRNVTRVLVGLSCVVVVVVYIVAKPAAPVAWVSLMFAMAAGFGFAAMPRPAVATAVTLIELLAVTWRYNPSAAPRDVLPVTGAIQAMNAHGAPRRMVALGWSFLPDTPSYFGLEDVKSTDPVSSAPYKRLMHGFLHVLPDYDETIGNLSEPFADFLNIGSVYAPPDAGPPGERFVLRYRGRDGSVYDNTGAMPRYFIPTSFRVNAAVEMAIPRLKEIRDFRQEAIIDHVPDVIGEQAPQLRPRNEDDRRPSAPGRVDVIAYRNNSTLLRATTTGWSLLASSDAYWPGWRAYVDGERVPTPTVNGAFLGAFVPPGTHRVEFRYRPAAFDTGTRVSAGALLLIAAVLLLRQFTVRRSSG